MSADPTFAADRPYQRDVTRAASNPGFHPLVPPPASPGDIYCLLPDLADDIFEPVVNVCYTFNFKEKT